MKKMCVVTYVFGEKYQSFIPYYCYSFLKEYPEYDIYIYVDRALRENCRRMVKELESMGKIEIRNIPNENMKISSAALKNLNIAKAMRWFLLEEEFQEYKGMYCGDIDIFICKEKNGIYESHMEHCAYLRLPYSNCLRTYREKRELTELLLNLKHYGIFGTYKSYQFPVREYKRLTGLHFFQPDKCFPLLLKHREEMIEELNRVAAHKSNIWTVCNINDESVLYEYIKGCGLGIPEYKDAAGLGIIENENPHSVLFRPHHGIHLALWRPDSFGRKRYDTKLMLCDTYQNYFRDFQEKYNQDPVLNRMLDKDPSYGARIIRDMKEFYLQNIKRESIE